MSVRVSISVAPLDDVEGDLAGMIGNFAFELLAAVSVPRQISSKANVMLIELITNTTDHCSARNRELRVDLQLEGDEIEISVTPDPENEDFAALATGGDPKQLLADTVHKRRIARPEGGLGLMRLTGKRSKKPPSGAGNDGGASAV